MAAPLEEAQRELEEAGERQREIDRLIAIENQKLEDLRQERANKGRGRPNKTHAGKVKGAEARLARLQRGLLPSEVAPNVPRTTDELVSSARQHPQHHAAASAAPVGRPSGSKRARGEGEPADDGETSDGDGDDGDESPEFKQFYRVSPAQRSFNEDAAHNYMTHELARSEITVHPDNLLASGCKHDLIGVGPVHICAPHKAGWVAERVGGPRAPPQRPPPRDVEMLLAQPRDATPAQLSDTAFARGLHLPPSRAEKLAAEAAAEERARLALEEANYRRLQQQLRTRVEPPALREAPPPQLAQAVGGDELPGPLPGMATQAVEPAQLSNGDDADKGPELAAEGGSDGEEAAGGEAMEDDGGGDGGGSGGRRRGGGGGSGRRRGSVGGDGGGRGTQRGGGRGGRGRRGGRGGSGGSGGGSSGGSGRSPIKKRGHDQRGGRSSQQVAADRARRNSEARAAKRAAARAKENAAAAALEQQGAQPAATSSGASATGILAGLHGRIFGSG